MSNTKIVYDCEKKTTSYVPLSAAEIAEREASAAQAAQAKIEADAKAASDKAALAAAKITAKSKLKANGLTDAEIAALIK
jgi:hypothetical protein